MYKLLKLALITGALITAQGCSLMHDGGGYHHSVSYDDVYVDDYGEEMDIAENASNKPGSSYQQAPVQMTKHDRKLQAVKPELAITPTENKAESTTNVLLPIGPSIQ